MARLDQLLPDIIPAAPGAPEFVVTQAIQDTARDFCTRSGIWQETLPETPLEVDESLYDFDTYGSDVLGVIWGYCDTTPLVEQADRKIEALNQAAPSGAPHAFAVTVDNQFRLTPIPDASASGPLIFRVMLRPGRKSRQVPDWLLADWHDALVHGTHDRLMRQPNKAWTSYQEAQLARRYYDEQVGLAKRQGMIGVGSFVTPTPQAIGSNL